MKLTIYNKQDDYEPYEETDEFYPVCGCEYKWCCLNKNKKCKGVIDINTEEEWVDCKIIKDSIEHVDKIYIINGLHEYERSFPDYINEYQRETKNIWSNTNNVKDMINLPLNLEIGDTIFLTKYDAYVKLKEIAKNILETANRRLKIIKEA